MALPLTFRVPPVYLGLLAGSKPLRFRAPALAAPASRIARARQEGGVAIREEAVALRHRVRVQRARAVVVAQPLQHGAQVVVAIALPAGR